MNDRPAFQSQPQHGILVGFQPKHVGLEFGSSGDEGNPSVTQAVEMIYRQLDSGFVVDAQCTHIASRRGMI